MKFTTTSTLLLASLFGTVLANNAADEWEGKCKAAVNPTNILFDPNGNLWRVERAATDNCRDNMRVLIPRMPSDKDKAERHLVEKARKINERRRLEEESRRLTMNVEAAPNGKGVTFSAPQLFEFSGLEDATELKLVFSQENYDDVEFDFLDNEGLDTFVGGVASTTVGFANGQPITYTWSLYYTVDEVEEIYEGGEVTFGPPELSMAVRNGNDNTVREAAYENGGQIQEAAGRIYFTSNSSDYACTGTAIKDNKSGKSLVFTAAHCVFDDINWQFGENAIFIPNRDALNDRDDIVFEGNETIADIHRYCQYDACGCWELSGGVVHDMWVDTPWPDRLAYDYGFYMVNDEGSHTGKSCGSDALDVAVEPLVLDVRDAVEGDYITNFGYSLAYNPDFRYCAETASVNQPTDGVDTAWMSNCGLTGGSSGGPWVGNFDPVAGSGTIVSVNSWSYYNEPGMGGPFIDEIPARCLVNMARDLNMADIMGEFPGEQGYFADCHDLPCVDDEDTARKLRGSGKERRLCSETVTKNRKNREP